MATPNTIALSAPFESTEVKFKPQAVKGNRALALAYVDCRVVQDRLDAAVGVENWMDEYEIMTDGSVMCRLKVKLDGAWVTKADVGSPSEQPDSGDRLKAAFSDALKRAAVKFGIGRYLYRLAATWTDYDAAKKQFTQKPQLPAWALPPVKAASHVTPSKPKPAAATPPPAKILPLPNSGEELHRRLREFDSRLAADKRCTVGALLSHVAQEGRKAGYGDDISAWDGPAIQFAADTAKTFAAALPSGGSEHRQAA